MNKLFAVVLAVSAAIAIVGNGSAASVESKSDACRTYNVNAVFGGVDNMDGLHCGQDAMVTIYETLIPAAVDTESPVADDDKPVIDDGKEDKPNQPVKDKPVKVTLPEKDKKDKCNNGNGNGAEGCNASDKGNNDETPEKGDKGDDHKEKKDK